VKLNLQMRMPVRRLQRLRKRVVGELVPRALPIGTLERRTQLSKTLTLQLKV
jgi:hypothetical protein